MEGKVLVLGDIHGRTIWKRIIDIEKPDKVIFLGDYVSTHGGRITGRMQLENLDEILSLKEQDPSKIILLRGNHDLQHLGYYWAQCSGFDSDVFKKMSSEPLRSRFLDNTKWVHIQDNIIFSHAGITNTWLKNTGLKLEEIESADVDKRFGFIPNSIDDYCGTSITQSCVWVRPVALIEDYIKGYDYFVGHTPVQSKILNLRDFYDIESNIYLCDALELGQYVVIENDEVKVHTIDF